MSGRQLIVSPRARIDLAEVLAYLAEEAGARVAIDHRERFRDLYSLLRDHPESGAPRPELGSGVRIGVVQPFLAIYLYDGDAVSVLRIVHGRRKITGAMLRKRK